MYEDVGSCMNTKDLCMNTSDPLMNLPKTRVVVSRAGFRGHPEAS